MGIIVLGCKLRCETDCLIFLKIIILIYTIVIYAHISTCENVLIKLNINFLEDRVDLESFMTINVRNILATLFFRIIFLTPDIRSFETKRILSRRYIYIFYFTLQLLISFKNNIQIFINTF